MSIKQVGDAKMETQETLTEKFHELHNLNYAEEYLIIDFLKVYRLILVDIV
jgi:hypothetical protein